MNKSIDWQLTEQKTSISIFSIWLVTISGMIGIFWGMADWFLPKTPFNLILGAGLLIWNFPAQHGWRTFAIWSLTFCIGMAAETLGVQYGLLFGEYRYGDNLGPKFLEVPFLIGINWVVLTFLTAYIGKRFFGHKWLACLAGALLMVVLDFFIEPVAPVFDFWHWDAGYAPLQNFVAWFCIAFVLQILVHKEVPNRKNSLPLHHFVSQIVFFGFFYVLYHV